MNGLERFNLLTRELGLSCSSERTVELLFQEDVVARIILHPNNETLVTHFFFYNCEEIPGPVRVHVQESLLMLNAVSLQQSACYVGMDSRGYLVLIGQISMAELNEDELVRRLGNLHHQTIQFKRLVDAMSAGGTSASVANDEENDRLE